MAAEQRVDPAEELLPEAALEAGMPQALREVEAGGRRKVITRDGQAVAVLRGIADYERLRGEVATARLLRDIRRAETEIDAGLGISQEQMEEEFQKRWGVPVGDDG